MQTEWAAALSAIATAGQSYTIGGRTFTRANLDEVAQMVDDIAYAKGVVAGTIHKRTYATFTRS